MKDKTKTDVELKFIKVELEWSVFNDEIKHTPFSKRQKLEFK